MSSKQHRCTSRRPRLRPRPHRHRPLRRAGPRLLHRPGLRGRADLRDHRREGPSAAVRLGRRRRALRRPRQALHRAGGAGHRRSPSGSTGCSRRCAPRAGIGGTARRARRRHRHGPRPHGRLPGDGGGAAGRRHPGRGLPRQPQELRQPVEVRRQARLPGGGDPGRGREGAGRGAGQGPDPRRADRRDCDA